jgi:hypothetical protein
VVTTETGVTVAERVRLRLGDLTHAERKVARYDALADGSVDGETRRSPDETEAPR